MTAPRPRLRDGLRIVEQVYRGEQSFVVKDPATGKYFRFRPVEMRVIRALDGTRTPAEVAAALAEEGLRVSAGTVEKFARQLTGLGLIERTLAERSVLQLERLRAGRRQRRRRPLFRGHLLRMRWSVGDPNAWFDRALPRVRWCFSRAFLTASVLLFAAYFAILALTWGEFSAAVASRYSLGSFTLGSFVLLWVTGLVVIVIHELGHGFTCKHFGGEVREMGFMLIYFQPALYCNVNDAWSFPELRARLWVTGAGTWIQLVVAAIAALVWLVAMPGTLASDVAVAAMLIGGLTTVLTNANPLLPLDGYFALSDYLEIPNLRQRATGHVWWWVKRHALRLELPEPAATERERRVFFIYGTLALAYIVAIFALLFAMVLGWAREALGALGAALTAGLLLYALRRRLRAGWRLAVPALSARWAAWRARQPGRWVLAGVVVFLAVTLAVPWPLTTSGSFVAAPAWTQLATAPRDGVVGDVFVEEGMRVPPGAPLVRLADIRTARDLAATARAADSLAAVEAGARARGLAGAGERLAAERASAASRLAALRDRAATATVRSSAGGVVVTHRPVELLGRAVRAGDPLVRVSDLDSVEVRIAFTGGGAALVRAGQPVDLVSYADPASPRRATIAGTSAIGQGAGAAGAVEARVRLAADPAWRPGARGEARAELGRTTLLGAMWWGVRKRIRGDLLL